VYRKNIRAFRGVEEGTPPLQMSVDDIIATTATRKHGLKLTNQCMVILLQFPTSKDSTFDSSLNIGK
jgi:hypothetical protein